MKFSLKKKSLLLTIIIAVIVLLTNIALFATNIRNLTNEHYSEQAMDLAETIAICMDSNRVLTVRDEVMKVYDNTKEKYSNEEADQPGYEDYIKRYSGVNLTYPYQLIHMSLAEMQEASHAENVYIFYPDVESGNLIYLVGDYSGEKNCPTGSFHKLTKQEYSYLADPENGFLPKFTTSKESGTMVSAGMPIHDYSGNIIAYVGIDYSLNEVKAEEHRIIFTVAGILVVLSVIFCFVVTFLVDRFLTKPLRKLTKAASQYQTKGAFDMQWGFQDLNIHTGDEFELLADAMHQMEQDVNNHIAQLISAKSELDITKEHAEEMDRLANKDTLTGIRNKRAYEQEVERLNEKINEGNTRLGLAMADLNDLKYINDTYGHDKGDIAIKKICHIFCHIFAHSPVFRYGGDEFIIILENQDLKDVDDLLVRFYNVVYELKQDSSLPPWEQVSAAIGYAIYNPQKDADLDALFRRADEAMYAKKIEMGKTRPDSHLKE